MRLTTTIEKKFLIEDSYQNWRHAGTNFAEVYFANDEALTKRAQATKACMLKLVHRAARVEVKFWHQVLISSKATTAGLNAANQRIRYLAKELGLDPSVSKAASEMANRGLCRIRASRLLEEARRGGKYGFGAKVFYIRRALRKGGLMPRHIGTSDTELNRIKKRKTRENKLLYFKHEIEILRAERAKGTQACQHYLSGRVHDIRNQISHYGISLQELGTSDKELKKLGGE